MRLQEALAIQRGDVVSFVGAGGKTTAMYRLAHELVALGWRVVTTTTTMIRPPTSQQTEVTILETDLTTLLQKVERALKSHHHLTVATRQKQDEKGKLVGLPPELVGELATLPSIDALLVEADGARGRSLKAPAPHEPPIPPNTTVLVPMMALDAMGKPLDEEIAHRPELFARLAGVAMGQPITPQVAATVLAHPDGGLKDAPPGARVRPLLNKVESPADLTNGQEMAKLLLASPRIDGVLLGAVIRDDPIVECWTKVAAVILAAGASRRLGRPKQLLTWGQKTMLEQVVEVALASSVQKVIVVLGYEAEKMRLLVENKGVQMVINGEWAQGLSASVRAGLEAVPAGFEACLFLLADQPKVTPQLIEGLLARHRSTLAPMVAPHYRGRRGNPVLFSRPLFPALAALSGDEGGRSLLERHEDEVEWVEVDSEDYFLDIDTEDDLRRAR